MFNNDQTTACSAAAAIIALSCIALHGCQGHNRGHNGSHAMLAGAGDDTISLFGEIPNVPSSGFESRAAVSLRQHSFPSEGSDFDPAVSKDGNTLVFASTRHALNPDIYFKDVDSVAVTQLTTDPASDIQPTVSPDGTRIAFASDRSGNWDIWIVGLNGLQPIQVTQSPAHEVHPSWAPDGRQLVFCSMPQRGGQWELWIASAEEGAVKKFIGYGLFPEWAPSRNTIVYQRARRRGSRWFSLWTLDLVDGEPRLPTEILSSPQHAMILPTWSPDEKHIAYCAVRDVPDDRTARTPPPHADIWMVDMTGRGKVRLTDGVGSNYSPTWSHSGRVFFTSSRAGPGTLEGIWSVIPVRAPVTTEAAMPRDAFGRSNEGGRVETAGFRDRQ